MQVFAHSTLSRIEFANRLGISNAVLSHISSGRNKAGMELVMGVLHHFPEISTEWLLFGKGHMLQSANATKTIMVKNELMNQINNLKQLHNSIAEQIKAIEEKLNELE